jgi:antirestriction protein ArdC
VVTARILEKLAAGVVPWQSPSIARVGFPRNFATGNQYRGINVFLLGCHDFQSPYFLTFIQAKELGGNVKKGEKGFPIVKMGTWNKEIEGVTQSLPNGAEEQATESRKFLKSYTVFNSCQIEGIEFPEPPKCDTFTESQQCAAARQIVEGMPNPPTILEGRRATPCYFPGDDVVEMPSRETFRAEWRFYKTMFHELAHSTGHESRLARKSLTENQGFTGRGAKLYCVEELVAEMTAAFLGAAAGIIEDDFDNSSAYLKGWMDVLKVSDHKKWLIQAASEAQKAADYILGMTPDASGKRGPL